MHQLNGYRIHKLNGYRIHYLNGYRIHKLYGYRIHYLNGYRIHQLNGYRIHQLNGYRIHWLNGYRIHAQNIQRAIVREEDNPTQDVAQEVSGNHKRAHPINQPSYCQGYTPHKTTLILLGPHIPLSLIIIILMIEYLAIEITHQSL